MKQVVVCKDHHGLRSVEVDDNLICFYSIREDGVPSIVIKDDGNDDYVFFEDALDPDSFIHERTFYVSHITSVYDLVESCINFCKECI